MEESFFSINLARNLNLFLQSFETGHVGQNENVSILKDLFGKQIWSEYDKSTLLQTLTDLLLDQKYMELIVNNFQCILPELLHRCFQYSLSKGKWLYLKSILQLCHIIFHQALVSELVMNEITIYLKSLIHAETYLHKENDNIEQLLWLILIAKNYYFDLSDILNIEFLLMGMENKVPAIQWLSSKLYAIYFNIVDVDSFLRKSFSNKEMEEMILIESKFRFKSQENIESIDNEKNNSSVEIKLCLSKEDFLGDFIPIDNMLFHRKKKHLNNQIDSIVLTPTTIENLRTLAYGIQSEYPVLLSGGISSGKTSLVESMASYVGGTAAPQFIKLQMGEQSESKSLIGSYACSNKPGEFHWQPGSLTQALTHGSWLLLEDIDAAPPDVIATIVSLIKCKELVIPGKNTTIKPAAGFKVIMTTRQGSSFSSKNNRFMQIISKLAYNVQVKSLKEEELQQLVEEKYSDLVSIQKKLVDIFTSLSNNTKSDIDSNQKLTMMSSSRKSTLRDFLKWCQRIVNSNYINKSKNFDFVVKIFQSAMQCFSLYNPVVDQRLEIGYIIGAKLSLPKEKVEHYIYNYKASIKRKQKQFHIGSLIFDINTQKKANAPFAFTKHSLNLLENIAVCVQNNEPVLLVGETGCGKTSTVQYLSKETNQTVHVINLSQQTDIVDLIGGFKPLEMKQIFKPIKEEFEKLFIATYSQKENTKFLNHVYQCYNHKRWDILFKLMSHCCKKAIEKQTDQGDGSTKMENDHNDWLSFQVKLSKICDSLSEKETLLFSFVEGKLIKALKDGDWILLDEVNLASSETLECLSSLLDNSSGSVVLTEKGDIDAVERHKNFRLFACMNPATDVGKKNLPYGIRNRFTEIYVDEMSDEADLKVLVAHYLQSFHISSNVIDGIVSFYKYIRIKSKEMLSDGSGGRPHYSLRTLCRGLQYAQNLEGVAPLRSIYEGLCMSFLTQLDRKGHPTVMGMIKHHLFNGVRNSASILSQPLPRPSKLECINVEGYWIAVGEENPKLNESYVLTNTVRKNLKDLARIVSGRKVPVLLQGDTSVGKTSLITYLSELSGNKCLRVNNHEHTDIQEYIGCYGADSNGKLVFKEGALVTAMRNGHWIILDELNLAPTDVLEALNRLLDDNRELLIGETQEVVKAHERFMLFATQNPPGQYGGRKMLSQAFRNRFVELHFTDIPSIEIEEILHSRCHLPQSYARKFVQVMLDLQIQRKASGIFSGKSSFMTLRDLFRWAARYRLSESMKELTDWEQCIAEDGFMLISSRCRKQSETVIVKDVVEKNFKRKLNIEDIYSGKAISTKSIENQLQSTIPKTFQHLVWTDSLRQLAILTYRALSFGESVLLVGETGCGKTTICQLIAELLHMKFYSINCHMHTESADFLGGLRPIRNKEKENEALFEWSDGTLVKAMQDGAMFLIDEISLADDSVLERLNSVLETDRILVLAEKGEVIDKHGKSSTEIIKAHHDFKLVATMNPGGDFGKKELSPALRNRFTEIWCSPSNSKSDLYKIIEQNIDVGIKLENKDKSIEGSGLGKLMVEFIEWFQATELGNRFVISIRDIISWVTFINAFYQSSKLDEKLAEYAYIHGAFLVFLDSFGSGNLNLHGDTINATCEKCSSFLFEQVGITMENSQLNVVSTVNMFGISPFFIQKGPVIGDEYVSFSFESNATKTNCFRLLRGLQVNKPILLEGSPGVGKTSLVVAVAKVSGHNITRINLSEETDITDLFGSDLPVDGGKGKEFAWKDGPFLKALKEGHWVIFDELNLASQAVLEGLNSCFDHRGEIFVPALNKTFHVNHLSTKIFACQNPQYQGGGRKGLPKSFLNRFTKVYVDKMDEKDFLLILQSCHRDVKKECLQMMVNFNSQVHEKVNDEKEFGHDGRPWEFNIRDLTRWCELLQSHKDSEPEDFVDLIYSGRMRNKIDREKIMAYYQHACKDNDYTKKVNTRRCTYSITENKFQVGYSILNRNKSGVETSQFKKYYEPLRYSIPYLESVMKCVQINWLAILVGKEGSLKSSMIRFLSQLTGNPLDVLSVNSSIDITDIIGGYEQFNIEDEGKKLVNEIKQSVKKLFTQIQNLDEAKFLVELLKKLEIFGKSVQENNEPIDQCCELLALLETMSSHHHVIETFISSIKLFQSKLHKHEDLKGRFEWTDGILVSALKKGHWLLVENVNFCSASVLDRLNGLLEPNGELSLDERGITNNEIIKIKPHPNFRLFLTMNPKYGEISRAMRNRGIEIFIPSIEEEFQSSNILDPMLITRASLGQVGLRHTVCFDVLNFAKENSLEFDSHVYLQYVSLVKRFLQNGQSYDEAVSMAISALAQSTKHEREICMQEKNELKEKQQKLSNIIILLPSIWDWISNSSLSRCLQYIIPLQLWNCEEISICQILLCVEQMQSQDISLLQKILTQILPNHNHNKVLAMSNIINSYFKGINDTEDQLSRTLIEDGDMDHSRFYLLLIQILNGIYSVIVTENQIDLSVKLSLRKLKNNPTIHSTFLHFAKFLHIMYDSYKEKWMQLNVGDLPKVELAFTWLKKAFEFCCSSNMTNMNLSFTQLVFLWKWLNSYCFPYIQKGLATDEMVTSYEMLDVLIGNNASATIIYKLSTYIGRVIPFTSIEQFKLIQSLSSKFQSSVDVEGRKKILEIIFANENVDNTANKVVIMETNETQTKCMKGLLEQCHWFLFQQAYLKLVSSFNAREEGVINRLKSLLNYALILHEFDLTHAIELVTAIQEYKMAKTHEQLSWSCNFESLKFAAYGIQKKDDEISSEKVMLSPCQPVLLFLKDVFSQLAISSPSLQFSFALKNIDKVNGEFSSLQTMMWKHLEKFICNKRTFSIGILNQSLKDIFFVSKAISEYANEEINMTEEDFMKLNFHESIKAVIACISNIKDSCKFISSHIIDLLECLLTDAAKISNEPLDNDGIMGALCCSSAILLLNIVKPALQYDVAEETSAKLISLNEHLENVNKELEMRYEVEHILSGLEITNFHSSHVSNVSHLTSFPRRVNSLIEQRECLISEIQSIDLCKAARPSVSQYKLLFDDFNHFFNTFGNTDQLAKLIKDVYIALNSNEITIEQINQMILKITSLASSIDSFISKINSTYPLYIDITLKSINAFRNIQVGINILKEQLRKKQTLLSKNVGEPVNKIFSTLLQLILEDPLKNVSNICVPDVLSVYRYIKYDSHLASLLNMSLTIVLSSFNYTTAIETSCLLEQILNHALTIWSQNKQVELEKQKREESLFRYKTTTHCESDDNDKSEEEMLFNSYFEDFNDLVQIDALNDSREKSINETYTKVDNNDKTIHLDEFFIYEVCKNFFLTKEIKVDKSKMNLDIMQQLMCLSSICQIDVEELDKSSMLIMLVISHAAKELSLSTSESSGHGVADYNVFRTCNIKEIISTKNVLSSLQQSVSSLLSEFEDHPTLILLSKIIDRILNLPMNTPLMKINAGFMLLLQQAQVWEEYAASHVSLKSHLDVVTNKIIEWRKLELHGWRYILSESEKKCEENVSKWWLHFYNLLQDFNKKNANEQEIMTEELISSIKTFIETSVIGEFESRLNLLDVLIEYMKFSRSTSQMLSYVMWNMNMYYKMILPAVQKYQQSQKEKVEKEIRDYEKIVKWNGLNFHAMKQTVEKSHRQLNKYVMKYKNILEEPVQRFLCQKSELPSSSISPLKLDLETSLTLPTKIIISDSNVTDEGYINKSNKISEKMKRFIKTTVANLQYEKLITDLDGFTGEMIGTIKSFQTDSISSLPKEKQKSAAKLIQQQKRNALASLFKELKNLGISYRKVLTSRESENDFLQLPTINMKEISSIPEIPVEIVNVVKSCNDYFFASIQKQSAFYVALTQPSKELTPSTISKFKGVTKHVMHMVCSQREKISTVSEQYEKLSVTLCGLNGLVENMEKQLPLIPNQSVTSIIMEQLNSLLADFKHSVGLLIEFVNCTPTCNQGCSPFTQDMLPAICLIDADSDELHSIKTSLKVFLSCVCSIKKEVEVLFQQYQSFPIYSWKASKFLHQSFRQLNEQYENTYKLRRKYFVENSSDSSYLFENIANLGNKLKELHQNYIDSSTPFRIENKSGKQIDIMEIAETIVQNCMVIIQTMLSKSSIYQESLGIFKEDESSLCKQGLLEPVLNKDMFVHINTLKLNTLFSLVEQLLATLKDASKDNSCCDSRVLNIVPFLHQISVLYKYMFFHLVFLHRTTTKLLYVLYGLFTDLIEKGFCLPVEEDENAAEGEGATEFEDIQGGGLGEGAGAKDVSEEIESQDQVEDTKTNNEEKEEKEENEKNDIKEEEHGLEMDDDFEGDLQDLQLDDENDNSDSENEDENTEPDEELGDVDDSNQTDQIDEKLWDDKDEDDQLNDEKKDSDSKVDNKNKTNPEIVSKDNQDDESTKENNEEKSTNNEELSQEPNEPPDEQDDVNDDENMEDTSNEENKKTLDDAMDIDNDNDNDKHDDDDVDDENKEEDETDSDEIKDDKREESTEESLEKTEDTLDEQTESDDINKNENEESKDEDNNIPEDAIQQNNSQESLDEAASTEYDYNNTSTSQHDDNKETGDEDGYGLQNVDNSTNIEGQHTSSLPPSNTDKPETLKRKDYPHASENRTLSDDAPREVKRKRTIEPAGSNTDVQQDDNIDHEEYEHIKDDEVDGQHSILDNATAEQARQQHIDEIIMENNDDDDNEIEDVSMDVEQDSNRIQEEDNQRKDIKNKLLDVPLVEDDSAMEEDKSDEINEENGIINKTNRFESTFSNGQDFQLSPMTNIQEREEWLNKLRAELQQTISIKSDKPFDEKLAHKTWIQYEQLTAPLARQLCDQLRLVLEPTLASKMSGDYRTGKRLNMRKVIPYIASQFRKDKIWLRRKKKSKRQYEIMIAVDDSSSMNDNHSKQLAFESMAVISNALTWLEAGGISICSFGEEARIVHPFSETFSEQSGAKLLQHFEFNQKKTRIAQLLDLSSLLFHDAKMMRSSSTDVPISQLLLIISDGRGIFYEGKEVVEKASIRAREAGIFVVFIILDDPKNKDSILDIKVPVFTPGKPAPEIKRYLEEFPFPFYLILRDIDSLPYVLSDALRQWFEVVTRS